MPSGSEKATFQHNGVTGPISAGRHLSQIADLTCSGPLHREQITGTLITAQSAWSSSAELPPCCVWGVSFRSSRGLNSANWIRLPVKARGSACHTHRQRWLVRSSRDPEKSPQILHLFGLLPSV